MPIYKMDGRRDGKQKYRVRINYTDIHGKPRQTDRIAYGADEAKILELKLLQDIKRESPAASITLNDLFKEYCKVRKNELRESTLNKICRNYDLYIKPFFGDSRLKKINVKNLILWKAEIDDKKLAVKTKKTIYSILHSLLDYAEKAEYLPKNPLDKIGNFKNTCEIKKEMDFYTPDEFSKFIVSARKFAENEEKNGSFRVWDFYVFFCLAFYTGMRKGEIHGLEWQDISGNFISIKRSVTQKLKGGDRTTAPKNKSSIRTIQVPLPLIEILNKHKKRWEKYVGFNENFKICGGVRCLRDTTIENFNKKCASAAGVKKIRVHDFRHSHASVLANSGINILEIARRLGHANTEMTWRVYSHLYPKEEERAVEILNKIT